MTSEAPERPAALVPRTSGLAIAALAVTVLGSLVCSAGSVAGIILGVIALVTIRRSGGKLRGTGLAIAGIIVGGIILAAQGAIVLVFFSGAQQHARLDGCISNQRQLVVAAKLYADDWDGKLPDVGSYVGGKTPIAGTWQARADWRDAIRDYVKAGDEVFVCPSVGHGPSSSYAWNRHLSGFELSNVRHPAKCPLLWDWVPSEPTAPGIPLDLEADRPFWPSGRGLPERDDMKQAVTRHQGGGLVLGFLDGHAGFVRPTRWSFQNRAGCFMPCSDRPMAWPPPDYQDKVISMYPQDPMRSPAGETR